MSNMRSEGSIPSGRAPTESLENQPLAASATGPTSSAWSGVGPKEGDPLEWWGVYPKDGVCAWHPAEVTFVTESRRSMQLRVNGNDSGEGLVWVELAAEGVRWRRSGAADPDLTAGKHGNLPLPVVPEPRRCKGAPGCSCDAVLGPVSEVPGDLCAHCENLAREIERQTAEVEEAFVDCDGCLPDRRPLSGKLCGRCRARRERFALHVSALTARAAKASCASLRALVAVDYLTADEAQGVQSGVDILLRVMAAELGVMSPRQEVAAVALIRDALGSIVKARTEGKDKAVRP